MYITINYLVNSLFNLYSAMLISLHFQPLKVVSRYRDLQLNLKWVKKTHSICDQTFTNLDVESEAIKVKYFILF